VDYTYLAVVAWITGGEVRAADPESATGRWRPLTTVLYRLGRGGWEFWSCCPAPISTSDGRLAFILRRVVAGAGSADRDPAA
jgi:hypothetical protein